MRARLPLALTLLLFAGLVVLLASILIGGNQGHLVYTLDDAYIHMAIAKNLVRSGQWGLGGDAFVPASSSPLWTLLLAGGYLLAGVNDWLPLALNILAGGLLILLLFGWLRRGGSGPWPAAAGVLLILLLAPGVPVLFCGMEHLLQAVIVLAFALALARSVARAPAADARGLGGLLLLSLLLTAVRFEDGFLVLVGCALLALRRRWGSAALVALAGLLPIVVHGLISLANGWYALPTSVLLKASVPAPTGFERVIDLLGRTGLREIGRSPHIAIWLGLAAAGLIALHRRRADRWNEPAILLWLFVLAMVLHVQFGLTGHFFRYEMYLLVLGAAALALAFWRDLPGRFVRALRSGAWPARVGWLLLTIWIGIFLGARAYAAHTLVPRASRNIYHQHYQMGRFFDHYYAGEGVAANDIGAVNYYAEIDCLDVWGLLSRDVLQLKREQRYSIRHMRELARRNGVQVAAIYDAWFQPLRELQAHWKLIGVWVIPDNVICGSPAVSFYAVDPLAGQKLKEALAEFAPTLPEGVEFHQVTRRAR
ncbi:MAG: hypothetical protein GF330_09620 [Candidatus Eisenbacteria bacterium]|nr:hypothetical protein [Candidatus Eisenbacteria bacterium]